jgi:hypothetical protein
MAKLGRRPRGEFAQSTQFSCRLQPDTRERLEAEAEKRNHSLTQELEYWLNRGFLAEDRAVEYYGNPQNAAICKLIGLAIQSTGAVRRKKDKTVEFDPTLWLCDSSVFDATVSSIFHLLAWFRPGGLNPNAGIHMTTAASKLLDELCEDDASLRPINLRAIKANLGELAQRPHPYGGEPLIRIEPVSAREFLRKTEPTRKARGNKK